MAFAYEKKALLKAYFSEDTRGDVEFYITVHNPFAPSINKYWELILLCILHSTTYILHGIFFFLQEYEKFNFVVVLHVVQRIVAKSAF